MINQNQTQNQSSFQQFQQDQPRNPYPKSQRKDSNSNIPMNSKFSSNKPYQSHHEIRNNSSNRERSRSRDLSPRQSFHNYPQGNSGQNNNYNNRNNKPYHYRQNNDRQFDLNMNKRERDNYSFGYNNPSYNPSRDDCLIIFPNNFFNFNSKDFIALKNELKRELKDDIYNIYYNYALSGISDKIFRFTTNPSVNYPCKSKAIKIISDFIFDIMKQQNDKVTYLKLIFVIPENVIGFIIGISGKNINQIRDETNTKIEVYTLNNTKNYRKIEIAGIPQSIADAGDKICEITKKYFNFNNEKILNRNNSSSPQREQNWGRDRNREQYEMDRNRERNDRYHEGHLNKDYDNNGSNNKEYRGMYNRERNEFRDMGYKNDYRNREGYRNYSGRDMKNNNYNNKDNNNYRDFGSRYKSNNYDKGNNNRSYYDNRRNSELNNDKDNNDSKNRDNYSNRSFSRKSGSHYSNENRSYHNNDGEWPEDKDFKNEENKNEELVQEQHSENNQNLEPGEAKDSDVDNNNYIHDNNNINNNENDIGVSNNENNNLDNNMNMNIINREEKEKNEIEEINSILARDEEENDKLCKIIIYLSSEEINLLNNSKNENDNIWINLENSSQCSISKITKIIDEKEISLITFNGTPKQNTLAIYQLQKYLLDTKTEKTEQNKTDN